MGCRVGLRLFFICAIFSMGSLAQAQAIHGVIRVVKGDVKIIQSSDNKEIKAKIGQKVFPKDTVVAGKDSRAKVVMVDNNEINISPDSKVQIQNYEYKPTEDKKNVLLNVLYGKVRAKVNQKYDGDNKFQVRTPSAVAGVRGTDFFTSYDRGSNETKIVTFEGKVAFGQPGAAGQILNAVTVAVGQTTSIVGNNPPPAPVNVPKAELSRMEQQSDAAKAPDSPEADKRQPATDSQQKDEKKDEKKNDEKGPEDKNSGDKRAEDKKGEEKKPDDKKADERKPDDRKPDERKADERKPDDKKPDERKADERKPDDRKIGNGGPEDKKSGPRSEGPTAAGPGGPRPEGPAGATPGPGGPNPNFSSGTAETGGGGPGIKGPIAGGPAQPNTGGTMPMPAGPEIRLPSSIGSGSMLLTGDLAGAPNIPMPPIMPPMMNMPIGPAPLPPINMLPRNDFINEVIGGTQRKMIINVNMPGP